MCYVGLYVDEMSIYHTCRTCEVYNSPTYNPVVEPRQQGAITQELPAHDDVVSSNPAQVGFLRGSAFEDYQQPADGLGISQLGSLLLPPSIMTVAVV